jgi:hypothetical protein
MRKPDGAQPVKTAALQSLPQAPPDADSATRSGVGQQPLFNTALLALVQVLARSAARASAETRPSKSPISENIEPEIPA